MRLSPQWYRDGGGLRLCVGRVLTSASTQTNRPCEVSSAREVRGAGLLVMRHAFDKTPVTFCEWRMLQGVLMDFAPTAGEWSLLLDLGTDQRATELDALYLEATLRQEGVDVVFYPWHPSRDVTTPIGALRPLKLLVPPSQLSLARELLDDVLRGAPARTDQVVPIDDVWVLPYHVGVLVRHIAHRGRHGSSGWRLLYHAFRLSVVIGLVFALLALVSNALFVL